MLPVKGGHAVGQLDLVREGMMYEQGHADLGFIDVVAQAFKESIVVVETGEYLADRPKNTAFVGSGRITDARTPVIQIQIISQTSTVAVI